MEFFTLILIFAGLLGTNADLDTTDATPTPEVVTILVTEVPVTTGEVVTEFVATTESPSTAALAVKFSMDQEYTSDLDDPSSTAFKKLESTVTTEVDKISNDLYGSDFTGSSVNSFKAGSVIADMTLKFKSNDVVPSSSTAKEKLSTQLANSTVLGVIEGSIAIVSSNSTSSNATTARPATPVQTTEGLSTQPASSSEGTLGLKFSLDETFTSDLLNTSSDAFQTKATTVVKEVNKVCTKVYPTSFRRSITNSFANGSIVTDMTLVFKDKSSVPSASNATDDLSSELLASSLGIIPGSISSYSTSSSGCPSPPASMALTVLSLILMRLARVAQ